MIFKKDGLLTGKTIFTHAYVEKYILKIFAGT